MSQKWTSNASSVILFSIFIVGRENDPTHFSDEAEQWGSSQADSDETS